MRSSPVQSQDRTERTVRNTECVLLLNFFSLFFLCGYLKFFRPYKTYEAPGGHCRPLFTRQEYMGLQPLSHSSDLP
jgi:hypothetical protein